MSLLSLNTLFTLLESVLTVVYVTIGAYVYVVNTPRLLVFTHIGYLCSPFAGRKGRTVGVSKKKAVAAP